MLYMPPARYGRRLLQHSLAVPRTRPTLFSRHPLTSVRSLAAVANAQKQAVRAHPSVIVALLIAVFGGGVALGQGKGREEHTPAIHYASRQNMLVAAREIETLLGEDAVSYDEDDIENHGFSDWSSVNSTSRAVAVVYPRSTDDVVKATEICHKLRVPIVPYGAGSSVEGNFSSPYSGIVVDVTHMDNILSFNPQDMDVVVQPGVNWVDLNKEMEKEKFFLPLDPSPTATVGGMVSTNCSGTNAFRYGTMKDWVTNVTVVLADGRVIKTRQRPRKTSAGYNLTSLFVGAEGTLGIITEITLKLAVVPNETSVAVVTFPTIFSAASAASRTIRSGIQIAAMELMDEVQMCIVNRHGSEQVRKMNWDETPSLFLKFLSHSKEGIQSDIRRVKELIEQDDNTKFVFAKTKDEEAKLWASRKEALWTMTSIKPEGHAIWSTDVAVPISRLAEIIEVSKKDCEKLGVFTSIVGHVGDGNFHEALMYDPKDPAQSAAVKYAVQKMIVRALEMDGTVSGEHAIGMGKKQCLMDELGPSTIEVMKQLQTAVDPRWIMNPGKIFDLPKGSVVHA